jgi:large subunit ribosomal protein L18
MSSSQSRDDGRVRRKIRIRKKVAGSGERPRLSVFRSASHIYAQVIDDARAQTVASASTLNVPIDGHGGNITAAKAVGAAIAERARAAGIAAVVFDRNGFKYHGRVKALADAARDAGLSF